MDWEELLQYCRDANGARQLCDRIFPGTELCNSAPTPHDGEPYGRMPLYAGDTGEVLLMGWREQGVSAPHDHGEANGYVLLLHGRFAETHWRFRDGILTPVSERILTAPDVIRVVAGTIHSMTSLDAGVSLHLYSPVIEGMRVYDLEQQRTLVVSNDCGAWTPQDTSMIISADAWV